VTFDNRGQKNPGLAKIGQKCRALYKYMKTYERFSVAGYIKLLQKYSFE